MSGSATTSTDSDIPLSVLVSWAHQDADWSAIQVANRREDVVRFVTALRMFGIDADADFYHESDDVDWTRWGPARIRDVDIVLIVVSRAWRDAWEGRGDMTRNIGAAAEADVIRSISMESRASLLSKCRVVLLPGSSPDIPDGLHGVNRHSVQSFDAEGMERLLRDLTNQPLYVKVPLGQVPILPPELSRVAEMRGSFGQLDGTFAHDDAPTGTGADQEQLKSQLRAQLAALPTPAAGEGPHLPWYREWERVRRELAAIERSGDDTSRSTVSTGEGPGNGTRGRVAKPANYAQSETKPTGRRPLRHYVYISSTKVDRLYNQLIGTEQGPSEASLEVRLESVLEALQEDFGGLDSPARVFRGELPMKHSMYAIHPARQPEVAMWLGLAEDGKTLVVLGGSGHFVDGKIPTGKVNNSGEGTLFQALAWASMRATTVFEPDRRGSIEGPASQHRLPGAWESDAADVWHASPASPIRVEFAAYWLSSRICEPGELDPHTDDPRYNITKVIVGSPLYVSYAALDS